MPVAAKRGEYRARAVTVNARARVFVARSRAYLRLQIRLRVAQGVFEREQHVFTGIDQIDGLGVGPPVGADLFDDRARGLIDGDVAQVGADPWDGDGLEV